MSQGNPLDARHPIRGLETGDAIAWTMLTADAIAPGGYEAVLRRMMRDAEGVSEVLVVAIPRNRRAAVVRSMERATTGDNPAAFS